jgi:hypothetical protein
VSLASRDRLSFPGFFARCCNPNSDPQSYVRTATRPTSRFKVTVMKQWILSTNAIVLSAVSGAAPAALHANARRRVKILEQSLSYAEEARFFCHSRSAAITTRWCFCVLDEYFPPSPCAT